MEFSSEEITYFNNALKSSSNYDFSEYAEKSLKRRLVKFLEDNNLDINKLINKIKKSNTFLEKLVEDLSNTTTELFRDPEIWQTIRYKILPDFINYHTFNIWHAGCSTGQEVYSMLILLSELGLFDKVQVYATDISNNVLEKAPKGVYRYRFNIEYLNNFDKAIKENSYNNKEYDVPYSKYFDINKSKDTINMKSFLQKKPAWLKHDLVFDKNIFNTKFDIIMCRNVLIYFNTQLQNKVLHLFYDCLHKDGYLVLGMQESILGPLLTKFEKTGMVYRRK